MSEGYCEIHKVQMKKYSNEKGEWYAHKAQDGTWCHGAEKKETGTTQSGKVETAKIRCQIWQIAFRAFPNDPEARAMCIKQGESYIFSGNLIENEEPFEYEG